MAPKTPAELVVFVVNGGAPQGAAGTMADSLKVDGYTNQPKGAADWIDHSQAGNTVMCRAGLDQEAAALATAVGDGAPVPVEAMVEPPPTGSEPTDDCVVVVGATGQLTLEQPVAYRAGRDVDRGPRQRERSFEDSPIGRRVDARRRELRLMVDRAGAFDRDASDGSTASSSDTLPMSVENVIALSSGSGRPSSRALAR